MRTMLVVSIVVTLCTNQQAIKNRKHCGFFISIKNLGLIPGPENAPCCGAYSMRAAGRHGCKPAPDMRVEPMPKK